MTAPSPPYYWIDRGKPLSRIPADIFQNDLDLPFRHFSLISVRSDGNLTSVRWDPRYPDSASIDAAIEKIYEANSATRLIFYKDGWFREVFADPHEAVNRLHAIQTLKNLAISKPGFLKQQPFEPETLPPLIKLMMHYPKVFRNYAIEAKFDEQSGEFPITFAGLKCATGQFLGPDWLDGPNLDLGVQNKAWDEEVTRPFQNVLSTWKPRYDHVLAALARPGGEPIWEPYHRVVLPRRNGRNYGTISLIARGPVDIAPAGGVQS